jgi:hypothetical protein
MVSRPRRLLVVSRNLALLRGHYEDVIAALIDDGVEVHIRFLNDRGLSASDYRQNLAETGRSVRVAPLPKARRAPPELVGLRLRQLANLLRFYHPDYRDGGIWLREQRFAGAPAGPRRWARRIGRLGSYVALFMLRLACAIDRVLPPGRWAEDLLAVERPDVVAAVPVIRTPEFVDVLKAAAWQGISTTSWVQSWDNLSSKGLLHFVPDKVFVWNDVQRNELRRYHRVFGENVCVTGAQTFDHWFDGEDPISRRAFCAEHGFDPDLPIVLYVGSSRQLESSSDVFFERWLSALRASGIDALKNVSVLARPHPTEIDSWSRRSHERVSVSPTTTAAPINSRAFRDRFRDELHHASVVVGLNTSAMIDAAIFGKRVCTVELPEFDFLQRGTRHFQYLKTVAGGFLYTSDSLGGHLEILGELIERSPYEIDGQSRRFVETFVRPQGMAVSSTSVFAEELLGLFKGRSGVHVPTAYERGLGRVAAFVASTLLEDEPGRELARRIRKRRLLMRKRLREGLRRRTRILRRLAPIRQRWRRSSLHQRR